MTTTAFLICLQSIKFYEPDISLKFLRTVTYLKTTIGNGCLCATFYTRELQTRDSDESDLTSEQRSSAHCSWFNSISKQC